MASKIEVTATETIEQELPTCQCGCGVAVNPKRRFRAGHDATYKSSLLKRVDGGDSAAAEELIGNGWYSQEKLEARAAKIDAKVAAKLAKAEVKAAKSKVEAVAEEAK